METEKKLTVKEEEFYRYLKKQLLFSGIKIRTKESLWDICQNNAMPVMFGNQGELLKQIDIDFVLYRFQLQETVCTVFHDTGHRQSQGSSQDHQRKDQQQLI